MIPLQDVIPTRARPRVTLSLIAIVAILFAMEMALDEPARHALILSYAVVPSHFSWPSAVTHIFLHEGLVHLAANLWMLWIFGDNLEDRLGRQRFLFLFLVAGAFAGVTAARLDPGSSLPLIGATGAVGGVIGGYLILFPAARVLVLVPLWRGVALTEIPAALLPGFWILAQGIFAGSQVNAASGLPVTLVMQLAGLAVGAGLARLLQLRARRRCEWWNERFDRAPAQPPERRLTSPDTSASSSSKASS
jgi:membrane associated rhomboid family serine protease